MRESTKPLIFVSYTFCLMDFFLYILIILVLCQYIIYRKYVVPTPIEEAIGLSRFISQVVLTGANRPYNVALLVPDWTTIRSFLKIDESVPSNDPRIVDLINKEIVSTCNRMKKYEVPTKWAFVEPFTAANSMLTPKMSIRRHKVIAHYADVIAQLYGTDDVVAESADAKGAKEHAGEEQKAA